MATPLEVSPIAKESGRGIGRVKYTHDAMIDQILVRPSISQDELALHFGYSVGWVSSIMNSDAFQARLASRKTEVVDPVIVRTLEEGMEALARQSLDIVQRKLKATENPDLAIKALDLSTKALGMGARPQNVGQINNYVVAMPPKATNEGDWARENRADLPQLPSGQVTDVVAKS